MQYFKESEFKCKCGCGLGMKDYDGDFLKKLDALRGIYNAPILITSAVRCEAYNAKLEDAAKASYHIANSEKKARAVDIGIIDANEKHRLLKAAFALGFTGIGVKGTMIHLDTREGPSAFWLYPAKKQA